MVGRIFDTHCYGYWQGLAHRQAEVHDNMRVEGVTRSVQIGTDLEKRMDFLKTLRSEPGDALEEAVWENSNRFFRIQT
jgi:Tat protein secretion system quality control protein TatD with DNase activity